MQEVCYQIKLFFIFSLAVQKGDSVFDPDFPQFVHIFRFRLIRKFDLMFFSNLAHGTLTCAIVKSMATN